jgi:hypothetical protein
MADGSSSGTWSWLDNLTAPGGVLGKAVDAYGAITTSQAKTAAQVQAEATAKANSLLGGATVGGVPAWVWIAAALVGVVGVVILIRR